MDTQYDVFISYSRKDSKKAKEIFEALSNASISCFFDDNIRNPDVWEILVKEIENCKVFLYLGSKNTASARITPKELTYAVNHKDRSCIYPYFIDDYALPKVHEFLLADINWRKMSTHPIETGLIPDLKDILSEKPPKPIPFILNKEVEQVVAGGQVFEMIRIKGGTLTIGATIEQKDYADKDEYPAHEVTLPTYYIGRFPVTQNIWEAVMGYNKSNFNYKRGDYSKYPAEHLTHDEAVEFVRRLSKLTNKPFALPTEEEWEYAARGGQESKGFIYAGSNDIDEVAWYRDNAGGTTHPVGEKKPNELGLYDMSGNVWEWTETPAHSYATDIAVGGTYFIRRGGSWWHEAKNCRVSKRYASEHSKKTSGLGLRVVIRESIV